MRGEGKEESYIVFCFLVLSSVVRKEFHVCSFFLFFFLLCFLCFLGPGARSRDANSGKRGYGIGYSFTLCIYVFLRCVFFFLTRIPSCTTCSTQDRISRYLLGNSKGKVSIQVRIVNNWHYYYYYFQYCFNWDR